MDFIDTCIERLFEREGGYTDNELDKGGATKYGITRVTLSYWLKREATTDDVKALDRSTARQIYRTLYFENTGIDQLHVNIAEQVFDFAVNSGPAIAVKALQECVSSKPDGKIGPMTVAAVLAECVGPDDGRRLSNDLAKWRLMMITRIVRRDPSQIIFLSGWAKRVLDFVKP